MNRHTVHKMDNSSLLTLLIISLCSFFLTLLIIILIRYVLKKKTAIMPFCIFFLFIITMNFAMGHGRCDSFIHGKYWREPLRNIFLFFSNTSYNTVMLFSAGRFCWNVYNGALVGSHGRQIRKTKGLIFKFKVLLYCPKLLSQH